MERKYLFIRGDGCIRSSHADAKVCSRQNYYDTYDVVPYITACTLCIIEPMLSLPTATRIFFMQAVKPMTHGLLKCGGTIVA